MSPISSMMRCSFSRMLATSCSGGRWVMSSLACGFLRSRLQFAARSSAAGTRQARGFSSRSVHQAAQVSGQGSFFMDRHFAKIALANFSRLAQQAKD